MKLFDKISEDGEEVEIDSSAAVEDGREEEREESRLKTQVEDEIVPGSSTESGTESSGTSLPGTGSSSSGSSYSGSSSSSSSSSSGSTLPGMSSSSGSSTGSSTGGSRAREVDLEDIHGQNKKIISLLEDIKSEVSNDGVL